MVSIFYWVFSFIQVLLTTLVNTTSAKMKPNLFSDGQLSFLQLREASSIESQLSEKDLMALESNLKELFLSQINGRKKVI